MEKAKYEPLNIRPPDKNLPTLLAMLFSGLFSSSSKRDDEIKQGLLSGSRGSRQVSTAKLYDLKP